MCNYNTVWQIELTWLTVELTTPSIAMHITISAVATYVPSQRSQCNSHLRRRVWCLYRRVWCLNRRVWYLRRWVWCLSRQVWCQSRRVWCLSRRVWCLSRRVWCLSRRVWYVRRRNFFPDGHSYHINPTITRLHYRMALPHCSETFRAYFKKNYKFQKNRLRGSCPRDSSNRLHHIGELQCSSLQSQGEA
jgi:hypothetical protein